MTVVTASLEADLATTEGASNVVGQSAVGIPPSSVDPAAFLLRVEVFGIVVTRPYDAELDQP